MYDRKRHRSDRDDVPGFERASAVEDPASQSADDDPRSDQASKVRSPEENDQAAVGPAETSDEFQADVEWHETFGWVVVVQSGCPHCGNAQILNAEISIGSQLVAYEVDDEDNPVLGQDDTYRTKLTFARCGNCREILVNTHEEADESDD